MSVPGLIPVTTPAADTEPVPEMVHIPPVGLAISDEVVPTHSVDAPLMIAGAGGAVTISTDVEIAAPQGPEMLCVITEVPALSAETRPVAEILATNGLLLDHDPDEGCV